MTKRITMSHVSAFTRLLGLLALILPQLLSAQFSYALDIPEIPGEEVRVGYENQIEIGSFSYGISTDNSGGTNRPTLTQGCFLLGKFTDRATPLLFGAMARHTRFDEMTLTAYRESEGVGEVIVYHLTNVIITKWETGAEDGTAIEEVIGLLPEQVEITYYLYDEQGGASETTEKYNFGTGL